jgi:N-acylneuraminate cytidylyltransferase
VQLLLDHPEADSVRGIVPAGQNPFKMWQLDEQGRMEPLLRVKGILEPYNAPRQILPRAYWQTGHIDAIWTRTILEKGSLSGDVILPLLIDPRYIVDLDNLNDWRRAEWLVSQPDRPEMVFPGPEIAIDGYIDRNSTPRPLPRKVSLVVFDFDGVMTDNRLWVDADGRELVAANRGDGMGIALLRRAGIPALVLSTEANPVVAARCRKLNLPVVQGLADKAAALQAYLQENQIDPACVVYVGNDVNDTPCFPLVGCAVVVADAHPEALRQADIVLERRGGWGAVRELCDKIIQQEAS